VFEHRSKEGARIAENQFSFLLRRSTTKGNYLLWRLIERYQSKGRELHVFLLGKSV